MSTQELSSVSAQDQRSDAMLAPAIEEDELARDLAEIERATIVLRRVQPGLESWNAAPTPKAAPAARPVWLLIGLLWLSTALVTAGAVAAIAALVG